MLLSVGEVSKIVGVCERTIWRLKDSGRMPAPVKVGRSVRWRRADIESWIACGCPSANRWLAMQQPRGANLN